MSMVANGACLPSVSVTAWRVLVYARRRDVAAMDAEVTSGLKGQRKARCAVHDLYLVKQPMSCDSPCCVKECTRKARWQCQGGIPAPCPHALCLAHGNDVLKKASVMDVHVSTEHT